MSPLEIVHMCANACGVSVRVSDSLELEHWHGCWGPKPDPLLEEYEGLILIC